MKTNYIGNHGVCYGITPNGEYFSYNPEKNGSYYHDTEEEARLSAIKINKMLDKKEMDGIKDFERINAMESIQKKNTVKLNEAQLKKIVAESVRKVLNEGVNPEIVDAMKQYLFATRNLRVAFSREDVAYGTTQGMNWEDMLTNIEGEIMEFLEGC